MYSLGTKTIPNLPLFTKFVTQQNPDRFIPSFRFLLKSLKLNLNHNSGTGIELCTELEPQNELEIDIVTDKDNKLYRYVEISFSYKI